MRISKEVAFQGTKQLLGILYLYISRGCKLPNSSNGSKVEYQLPFEGKWTVVAGGYEKAFSHSWGIPTQRYAYDFLIMDDDAKTYQGNPAELTSYACYGKNILAPADGVIVSIGNACEDEKPFADGAMDAMAKDIRGNFILIKHAEKEYGFLGQVKNIDSS